MRWHNFYNEEDKDEEEKVTITVEEKERLDIVDAKTRQVYDSETKILDLRKLRATDVKLNSQVYLPESQNVKYESQLELIRTKYLEIFKNYVKEKCDSKHRQSSNLSASQSKGIKKLKKRISDGELIVCLTDKSGKLAVMPTELYHECGKNHTDKDEEVDVVENEWCSHGIDKSGPSRRYAFYNKDVDEGYESNIEVDKSRPSRR